MASQEARYAESNKILVNLADFCTRNKLPPTYICSAYAELYSNYQNLGDIDQAKHYISLCIDHAEREKMLHYIPETLRDMAQIQRKTGNATLAQQYERQYLSLMDSIYNSQRFNVVKNQQFMYEVDKTDKEITRLHQEEEIHRQNARLYQLLFLVSILAIVLVSMLLFYVVRQKRDWRPATANSTTSTAVTWRRERRKPHAPPTFSRKTKNSCCSTAYGE